MSETEGAPETGGILKASGPGVDQITVGLDVKSIDGERIGRVKEVGAAEFLVDRPMARDLWVPFSAVVEATAGGAFRRGPAMDTEIVLSVAINDIDDQGWRHP